ncbi:hypothetical protein EII34_09150 [Arachnia propionica]|uniref:HIRAN domain-containing protein n=1 Tax=Arachnia propionica TaxID=1750 RepID=A0A3P1T5S3_9ACTN|nr:hypothetical protein [Arachnia propionica]RRD04700.1 hypothetical protein EII34_09150 [Arachnia propionica]
MADVLSEQEARDAVKFRLIWKNPVDGGYHEVGQFEHLRDGRYVFAYREDVGSVDGFHPLLQFPDTGRPYVSEVLPAFFANRVMSRKRVNYGEYVGWLGLTEDALPVEILARTGGGRETDTFHVVDSFEEHDGRCEGWFFISGVRHQNEAVARELKVGDQLELCDEPDNPVNPRAILLTTDGTPVGWVPDWLVDTVHRLRETNEVEVFVDQVNLDAPSRLAVLCRLEAGQLSTGREPSEM